MARKSELQYGSGGGRPETQVASMMAAYRLPTLPVTVVKEVEEAFACGRYDSIWSEAGASYSRIIEAGLSAGVVTPEQLLAVNDSLDKSQELVSLYKQTLQGFADRLHARVQAWLAKFGLETQPERQYGLICESHAEFDEDQKRSVIVVEHLEGMYYSFRRVPPRLRERFEILAKRVMRACGWRGDTDDFLDMTSLGEAIGELKALVDCYEGDIHRAFEHVRVDIQRDRGAMLGDYLETHVDMRSDNAEAEILAEMKDLLELEKEFEKARESERIASEHNADPVAADREMREFITRIRSEGVTEYEQRWLSWFDAALVVLRWHRGRDQEWERTEIPPGEFMDSLPLPYTSLIDFQRWWCDEVTDMMAAHVYQGGEPAMAMFPCNSRREAEQSLRVISGRLFIDAIIQAAICLDDE